MTNPTELPDSEHERYDRWSEKERLRRLRVASALRKGAAYLQDTIRDIGTGIAEQRDGRLLSAVMRTVAADYEGLDAVRAIGSSATPKGEADALTTWERKNVLRDLLSWAESSDSNHLPSLSDILARARRALAAAPTPPTQQTMAKPAAQPDCPITRRPFFMRIEHPDHGPIDTFGGPFDSYGVPYLDDDGDLRCERYDHDRGEWIEGGEPLDWWITTAQPEDLDLPPILDKFICARDGLLAERLSPSAASPAAQQTMVPDGWQLVPKEPTEEMHVAAVQTILRCAGNDDFPPRVYRAMLAAAPHPVAEVSGWISVKDRLPPLPQRVLSYSPALGYPVIARLQDNGNGPFFSTNGVSGYYPTHWMPLPAAPEAQKQGEQG